MLVGKRDERAQLLHETLEVVGQSVLGSSDGVDALFEVVALLAECFLVVRHGGHRPVEVGDGGAQSGLIGLEGAESGGLLVGDASDLGAREVGVHGLGGVPWISEVAAF